MLAHKNNETKEVVEESKNLKDITFGKGLDDLVRVTSSRNCDVFKINEGLFLTAIKKEVYKDSLLENIREIKREVSKEDLYKVNLRIHDIVLDNGSLIGYTTDSYDMSLKDYFMTENPSLTTTKIILNLMRSLMMHGKGHGDISLDNLVIKDGKLYFNNSLVRYYHCHDDFYLLNDIERDILAAHGHPCNEVMPINEADMAVYDYYYYLLVNTSGEERSRLIELGMENIYKKLFETVPNKHINEEDLEMVKKGLRKVEHYPDGSAVHHLFIKLL